MMQIWEKTTGPGDLSACGQSCARLQWSYKNREDWWNNYIFCFKLYSPVRESFRLKLRLCRLLDPCCFSWKLCARGAKPEHQFISLQEKMWLFDCLFIPIQGQSSQTAFTAPFEPFYPAQAPSQTPGGCASFRVVWELWHRLNSGSPWWVSTRDNQRLNKVSVFSNYRRALSIVWGFTEHQAAKQTDGSRELE